MAKMGDKMLSNPRMLMTETSSERAKEMRLRPGIPLPMRPVRL